jgi:predicted cupin superfamily sugar epimerase
MHTSDLGADAIIALLGLLPHPEGGHYLETYRSAPELGGLRPHGTAIYFLLRSGERSHWHRVDADEMWHYYAGAPLELAVAAPGQAAVPSVLGKDLTTDERPQRLVPRGHWQAARSLGAWTLVGCTVSPAFEFSGFELAPVDFEPGAPDS